MIDKDAFLVALYVIAKTIAIIFFTFLIAVIWTVIFPNNPILSVLCCIGTVLFIMFIWAYFQLKK